MGFGDVCFGVCWDVVFLLIQSTMPVMGLQRNRRQAMIKIAIGSARSSICRCANGVHVSSNKHMGASKPSCRRHTWSVATARRVMMFMKTFVVLLLEKFLSLQETSSMLVGSRAVQIVVAAWSALLRRLLPVFGGAACCVRMHYPLCEG